MSSGGRFYWVRNRGEDFKAKGIIVVFAWVSISDVQLKDFVALCSSLGWNCLVSRADYLNPYVKNILCCTVHCVCWMIVVVFEAVCGLPFSSLILSWSFDL